MSQLLPLKPFAHIRKHREQSKRLAKLMKPVKVTAKSNVPPVVKKGFFNTVKKWMRKIYA